MFELEAVRATAQSHTVDHVHSLQATITAQRSACQQRVEQLEAQVAQLQLQATQVLHFP